MSKVRQPTKEIYWDLEIAYVDRDEAEVRRLLEQPVDDVWDLWPFGVSVGAIAYNDTPEITLLYGQETLDHPPLPYMRQDNVKDLVRLLAYRWEYKRFTMNGTLFDWKLLAKLSGLWEECTFFSQNSYDPCFQNWCHYGFPVGLEGTATYLGMPGKEMSGESAPLEWLLGNYDDVFQYVTGDCLRLKAVVEGIKQNRGVYWRTRAGGIAYRPFFYGLMTAAECVKYLLKRDIPTPEPGVWWADELGLSVGG